MPGRLIDRRQYVLDSDGVTSSPAPNGRTRTSNGTPGPSTAWHLGLTEGSNSETKERYVSVFGDFRRVHRSGLIACVYRAAERRHKAVELAAHELLQRLNAKAGIS